MAGESNSKTMQCKEEVPQSSQGILAAVKGGGILFLGRMFEYGSRFIFGIIVARALGADGYGLYTLAVTVVAMLGGIAVLGADAAMVRFLPPSLRERNELRVWGTLQIGLILPAIAGFALSAGLFLMSDLLAASLFHDPSAAATLRWISLVIPLTAIGRVLTGAIRGFQQMKYQVYAESILFNLSRLGLTLLLLALGFGLSGTLVAYALALLLADGLMLYFLNRLFSLRRPLFRAERDSRGILSFSVPISLTEAVGQLGTGLGLFLLGLVGTVVAVGVFSAAQRIHSIGSMFLGATLMATRPIISDLHHRGEVVQLGQIYKTLSRWSFALMLPYFLTVVLFAEPMLAIFGEEFVTGAPALIILGIGTLVSSATGVCRPMLIMTGHSKLSLANTIAFLSLRVTLSLIFIPAWGLIGAALASTITTAIGSVARLLEVRWLLKLWPYNRAYYKPAVASLVALTIGLCLGRYVPAERNLLYLLLSILVLWSGYIVMILLLGLTAEDRVVLARTKRRVSAALNWR